MTKDLRERLEAEARLWEPSPLTLLLREALAAWETRAPQAVGVADDRFLVGSGLLLLDLQPRFMLSLDQLTVTVTFKGDTITLDPARLFALLKEETT